MRKYSLYFGTTAIIIALLFPFILMRDPSILYQHTQGVLLFPAGMILGLLMLMLCGIDQRCLSIDTRKSRDFFTIPLLATIFIGEAIIFYFWNPAYVKAHSGAFGLGILGIIITFAQYMVIGGVYKVSISYEEIEQE